MPHVNAVHEDKVLTNISVRYSNASFVGETMFPPITVTKETDKYFVYGKEHFVRHGTLRADGAESNEFKWSLSKASYACEEYALKTPVTDREKKNADAPIKPKVDATEMLTEAIKMDWEIQCQTLATAATSVATGHTAAAATQWDTTTADAYGEILIGQETIRGKIAKFPNHIFIPSQVAMYLAQNDKIQDMLKYTHNNILIVGPGSWLLPPVLWGMKVVVMMSIQNTANIQQAESVSDIWSDTVILAYINPSPGLKKLTWGVTFQSQGWKTKTWREEPRAADIVEVNVIRDLKIVATDAAYTLTDVLS